MPAYADDFPENFQKKWVNHFFYVIPKPLIPRRSTLTVA